MEKKQFRDLSKKHPAFNKNADPFFNIIMEGLKGEVDGDHFWDAIAENAIFEYSMIMIPLLHGIRYQRFIG